MDFQLSDDQKMLVETVQNFTKKDSPVERVRKIRDSERGWDEKVWRQMGELGWLGLPFPEELGGLGGAFVDVGLILEELGATLVPEPYLPSVILAGLTLRDAGTQAQKEKILPPMIEGRTSLALAFVETDSRHDVCTVGTRAEKTSGGYKLTGKKEWVLNGQAADHILVSARTSGERRDRDGVSLFLVDRGAVKVTPVSCMDSHKAAFVELEGVEVGPDALVGSEGKAADLLELAQDRGAAAACAEGTGIMRTVLGMTRNYLCEREQFGVKIGTFQALQHRCVDMFVETELAKGTSLLAVLGADFPDPNDRKRAVSTAKLQLARGGFFVTRQGIQLHGGIGTTDEHDVGLYFKRMQILNAIFGDEEFHVERFSRLPSFTAGV
jgi:alkylation response protein AidB-like acyl-CoA dehydrogenase